MQQTESRRKQSVVRHNLQNLVGGTNEFEDEDMETDVMDVRFEKQIERMINENLTKTKKGSDAYQKRE